MWIRQYPRNERGFTLIEMLIVLAIFSMLTLIVFSMMFRFYEERAYDQAIERFRFTLHEAQQMAIVAQGDVRVYVTEDGIVHSTAEFANTNKEATWSLPEGMQIRISTNGRIIFKANGNVSQIGRITIETPNKTKIFTINLSKGRLRENE